MARIFRIKNRFLRWMAGLVALGIDALFGLIKTSLVYAAVAVGLAAFIALLVVLAAGIGEVAHYLLALIGISDASLKIPSGFQGRFVLGFLTVITCCVLGVIIRLIVEVPSKAKKFGDRYFNSIGDKKQAR